MPVSVFCVLQGSGVTFLKCGEIYDMDFVANFMENTIMKKMKIGQTCTRMYSGTVFIEKRCIMTQILMAVKKFADILNRTDAVKDFRRQTVDNNELIFSSL